MMSLIRILPVVMVSFLLWEWVALIRDTRAQPDIPVNQSAKSCIA